MDVTRILESDHREVEQLITEISTTTGDGRTGLVEQLRAALHAHMELEETAVYACVKELLGDEAVKGANAEHELSRKALSDVTRLSPDKPGFGAALDVLRACLDHHIAEEESEVFPALRKNKAAMQAMVAPFTDKRLDLGMAPTVPALAD